MATKLENIYSLYAENLKSLKKHPEIRVEPDWADSFICPMCFGMFDYEEVKKKNITLEHVPPRKLGGKARTLTCKACNNQSGTELDSQLKKKITFNQFFAGKLNQPIDIQYSFNSSDDLYVNAEFSVSHDGAFHIVGVPERTNPLDIDKITQLVNKQGIEGFAIRFSTYKHDYPEAALLRIAYLWAFSVFGYCYIIHSPLDKVREQIRKPKEKILESWGITELKKDKFPDNLLGINFIRWSDDICGFLVVFDIKQRDYAERFAVLLPGLNSLEIYKSRDNLTAQITNIETKFGFAANPFLVLAVWNNI